MLEHAEPAQAWYLMFSSACTACSVQRAAITVRISVAARAPGGVALSLRSLKRRRQGLTLVPPSLEQRWLGIDRTPAAFSMAPLSVSEAIAPTLSVNA